MHQVLWVSSGDSHVLEPDDLWDRALPPEDAARTPKSHRKDDLEIVYVDGGVVRRDHIAFWDAIRPPGARDLNIRLKDLDSQGIRREVCFPSTGLWLCRIREPRLNTAATKAWNDWAASELNGYSSRFVGTAILPTQDTDDAVAELQRAVGLGFKAAYLPTTPAEDRQYNSDIWEPLWAAAAEARIPLCFHIGTGFADERVTRGPGGAVINYVEVTFPGARVVTHLVGSGALDRHPELKVLIAEGGAGWIAPFGDRMDEAVRQHDMFVRPKLSMLPSEFVRRQVYGTFQNERSAVGSVIGMGFDNVIWGSDYPHLEGTWPNTQPVLHDLFDDVDPRVVERVTQGAFDELFGSAA